MYTTKSTRGEEQQQRGSSRDGGEHLPPPVAPSKPRIYEIGFYLMSAQEIRKNLSVMEVTKAELYDSGNALITNATIAASIVNRDYGPVGATSSAAAASSQQQQQQLPKLTSKLMAITNSTNVKNRVEMDGGLLDYRLGSTDRRKKCKTCFKTGNRTGCPGHFGHIELCYPVFFVMTLGWCKALLNILCHFCSGLLVDKKVLYGQTQGGRAGWELLLPEERWERIAKVKCANVCMRKCLGNDRPMCTVRQPSYHVDKLRVVINWTLTAASIGKQRKAAAAAEEEKVFYEELEQHMARPFMAPDAWNILSSISEEDLDFLGFQVDEETGSGHPREMIITCIPVESKHMRPTASFDKGRMRSQNDKTRKYQEIIKANIAMRQAIVEATGGEYDRVRPDMALMLDPVAMQHIYAAELPTYEWQIGTLFNNENKNIKVDRQRSGRPYKSLQQMFKGKQGWWRQHLVAKRVDHTSRAVISPGPQLDVDELGVPVEMCTVNTIKERVTHYNIGVLTEAVRRGPGVLGGASHVYLLDGTEIDLKYVATAAAASSSLSSSLKGDQQQQQQYYPSLRVGMSVCRYIREGDMVLFNRQPSLYKMSMLALRVVPVCGWTLRPNMSLTTPYNADFDGDEMNMHVLQGVEEMAEAELLMSVESNLMSTQSSKLTMGLVQDALVAAWQMTNRDVFLTEASAHAILAQLRHFGEAAFKRLGPPAVRKPVRLYTGKQVYSAALFYETLCYSRRDSSSSSKFYDDIFEENLVMIYNGCLLTGRLCKRSLGQSGSGLLYHMCRDPAFFAVAAADAKKGPPPSPHRYVLKMLGEAQRVANYYLMAHSNFSIGPGDLLLGKAARADLQEIIDAELANDAKIRHSVSSADWGDIVESTRQKVLRRILPKCASVTMERLTPSSAGGCLDVIECGSKGSSINAGQMMACVGQQTVEGSRLTKGRLPCFPINAETPETQGMIRSSLLRGLTPSEFYQHAQAGREGLVDTAVKTAETGYIQRRIVRASENVCIDEDLTVRRGDGGLMQERYGGDGWATEKLVRCRLPYMRHETDDDALAALCRDFLGPPSSPSSENEEEQRRHYQQQQQYMLVEPEMLRIRRTRRSPYYKIATVPIEEIYMPSNLLQDLSTVLSAAEVAAAAASSMSQQQQPPPSHLLFLSATDVFGFVESLVRHISSMDPEFENFTTAYYIRSSLPVKMLLARGITEHSMDSFVRLVICRYRDARCIPGTAMGMTAAESIGEPTTQLTLNTFHLCGVQTTKVVTSGVPRMKELIALHKTIKLTTMTIILREPISRDFEQAQSFATLLQETTLEDVVRNTWFLLDEEVLLVEGGEAPSAAATAGSLRGCLPPPILLNNSSSSSSCGSSVRRALAELKEDSLLHQTILGGSSSTYMQTVIQHTSRIGALVELDHRHLLDRGMTPQDVAVCIADSLGCVNDDLSSPLSSAIVVLSSQPTTTLGAWYVYCRFPGVFKAAAAAAAAADDSLEWEHNMCFLRMRGICSSTILSGIKGISAAHVRQESSGEYVVDTVGSNLLDVLVLESVDASRTTTNNLFEIESVFGIDAASDALFNEYKLPLESSNASINDRHLSLIADLQTTEGTLKALTRHGINQDHAPLTQMAFEESIDNMYKAAFFGKTDHISDVTSNAMLGQNIPIGTGKIGFSSSNSRHHQPSSSRLGMLSSETSTSTAAAAADTTIVFVEPDIIVFGTDNNNDGAGEEYHHRNDDDTTATTNTSREAIPVHHDLACAASVSPHSDKAKYIRDTIYCMYGIKSSSTVATKTLPCSLPRTLSREDLQNSIAPDVSSFVVSEKTDGARYLLLLSVYQGKRFACMVNRNFDMYEISVAAPAILFDRRSLYDTELIVTATAAAAAVRLPPTIVVMDVIQHAGEPYLNISWQQRYSLIHSIFQLSDTCTHNLAMMRMDVFAYTDDGAHTRLISTELSDALAQRPPVYKVVATIALPNASGLYFVPKTWCALASLRGLLLKTNHLTNTRYPCDGLIIQVSDSFITPFSDPNIYKWKPRSLATIDVAFLPATTAGSAAQERVAAAAAAVDDATILTPYLYDISLGTYVPCSAGNLVVTFSGSSDAAVAAQITVRDVQLVGIEPAVASIIAKKMEKSSTTAAAVIAECAIVKCSIVDCCDASARLTLRFVKLRDKTFCNSTQTASAVLQTALENITLDDLLSVALINRGCGGFADDADITATTTIINSTTALPPPPQRFLFRPSSPTRSSSSKVPSIYRPSSPPMDYETRTPSFLQMSSDQYSTKLF